MDNRDEILAQQIGAMGGSDFETRTPRVKDEEPREEGQNLGKAKFFGANTKRESAEHSEAASIRTGWIEVDRGEFEGRGIFYPSDWKFFVKPATVQDIKNYSSIDETRPDQVQSCINEMLKSNFKISSESGVVSWNKLNDWDRLFILTKIREYTFVKGESEISFFEPCEACDEDVKFELKSSSLVFTIPDKELIDTYFDPETRSWSIDPREYDINGPVLTFYIPTIEVANVVFKWSMDQAREQQRKNPDKPIKINETFIKFLPWMLSRVTRDDKINDRFIRDAEATFRGWGMDMFGLASEVLEKISVLLENKLRTICPHCGEEVTAPVQFRNGLRDLFAVQSGRKKFGEK